MNLEDFIVAVIVCCVVVYLGRTMHKIFRKEGGGSVCEGCPTSGCSPSRQAKHNAARQIKP